MIVMRTSAVQMLMLLGLILATWSLHALGQDNAIEGEPRKELARIGDDWAPRSCTSPNCAKVLSIRHPNAFEPPPTIAVQGNIKRNPPFGGYNPHVPPINQPSAVVQKKIDIWLIEVQRRDGTITVVRQNHPVLFQVGDEVLVERDHVRAPE